VIETYGEINDGRSDERPVTAEMSISNISTQDWSDPNSSDPIGDVVGRGDGALVELLCQKHNQIGRYTIIRHTFKDFVDCTIQKK
jgi:hypothetical protein